MDTLLGMLPVLGRLFIGFYFVFIGVWNIYHWRPTMDVIVKDHIPSPIFMMSIGVAGQIILGVMLMCNIYSKVAALLLLFFTVLSVFMFHPFWKFTGERKKYHLSKFVDNLTVTIGALLLLLNVITPLTQLSGLLN